MTSHSTDFRPIAGLDGYELEEICLEQPHSITYRGRRKIDDLRVLIRLLRDMHSPDQCEDWLRRDYRISQMLRSNCAVRPFAFELTNRGPALFYGDEGGAPLVEVIR